MGWTNRAKTLKFDIIFNSRTPPTVFRIALVTNATVPTVDTNTFSQLTEITAGNGYTAGGITLNRNTTDFPSLLQNDAQDRGEIKLREIIWTASGGSIPASGTAAYYAVLIDDAGTPNVWHYFSLGGAQTAPNGSPFKLQNTEIRLTE